METWIRTGLTAIESALGQAKCTNGNPCGAVSQYNHGDEKPWQIADDQHSEAFCTLEDAIAAAGGWSDSE